MDTFSSLVAQVKISIENPETEINSVFGRGIAELCVGVREKGSLYAAAKSMGMAYSKAWRIMKDTETALGMQLLNRDGAHGSDLTDEGNKLIDVYLELEKKIQTDTNKAFRKLIAG